MDSTVLDRLYESMKIYLPIKRIMYMFFQEHILFLRFGQIVSRYTFEVTHWSNDPKIKKCLGISAFLEPCQLAHFLLNPSRTLKVQQVIYWIWKWRVEYYSKLDISSYPFLLISNELWPTAQVLLFLQDGLNLLQVSLAWYRWSLWDADSWPRVVQKNHVFTMESKVRSAEVTYPPEV